MNPRLLSGVLLAGSLSVGACADSVVAPKREDILAAKVASLGFGTAGMRDVGDYVVVEGDIRLEKAALLNGSRTLEPRSQNIGVLVPGAPRLQWGTDQLVSNTYVRQITVNLSALSSGWAAAARSAVADYNVLNTAIHMSETASADITLSMTSFNDPNAIAQATFPLDASSAGKPGPTIQVSTAYENTTPGFKEIVMAHELGHTLGMRHTDWQANNESVSPEGATQIWQTPATDAASVMNSCNCGREWTGFSSYDVTAFDILYPYLNVAISGRQFVMSPGTYSYSATVSGGTASSYYYTWQVRYCYQYPCSDGPFSTFAEGVDLSSVSMNFDASDFVRDIYVTVQEYSGGTGGKGYGLITVDGPSE